MNPAWWGLAIALGGIGALVRVAFTAAAAPRLPGAADTATGIVNVVGAGAAGAVAVALDGPLGLVLAAGLLSGMTTFSTWMVGAERAWSAGRRRFGVLLVVLPLLLGLAVCGGVVALARL